VAVAATNSALCATAAPAAVVRFTTAELVAAPCRRALSVAEGKEWFVYMLSCSDGSLYTGIATDVQRRFAEHAQMSEPSENKTRRGAKYFLGRKPLAVVYTEGGHDRSSASRREAEIKRLSPSAKRALAG